MNLFNLGETVELKLITEDGDTSQYPRALAYRSSGSLEATIDLIHSVNGKYTGPWTPATNDTYNVQFFVYSNSARTIENKLYARSLEFWRAFDDMATATATEAADAVWDEDMALHNIANSAGDFLTRIPVTPAGARERVVQGYSFVQTSNTMIGNLWLEKDGQLELSVTSCTVDFYDSSGVLLFSETDLTPDAQGIFKISRFNPGFVADQLVYAVATVTLPGPSTVTTVKTITAVG